MEEARAGAVERQHLPWIRRPIRWDDTLAKFGTLWASVVSDKDRDRIVGLIAELDSGRARDLASALRELNS
jgi:hypothetical protein